MGFFNKILSGLSKTRENFCNRLDDLFAGFRKIDDELFDELEEILITSDIGIEMSENIVSAVKKIAAKQKCNDASQLKQIFIDEIKNILDENNSEFVLNSPAVILVVGVNGSGKTTSIAKIANLFKNQGKKVMLAAADTFRAAAIDQLEVWAKKIDVPIIKHQENADPGAVIFDAIQSAKSKKIDVLICDTAGRLHNKVNLMNELKKIFKIINEEYPSAQLEVFISIDATIGQNALQQVKLFNEAATLTGIILTKLESSAKGGIVIPIQNKLQIPIRFVGIGEKLDDIQEFNAQDFATALFENQVSQ